MTLLDGPIDGFMAFSGIVPGKVRNGSASSFVNSAINASTPNSTIHKAAGLTVPGHSMILPGTIPETPISCEWSWWLERHWGRANRRQNTYRRFCE